MPTTTPLPSPGLFAGYQDHPGTREALQAIERGVRRILEHSRPTVCRHWAIAAILGELEAAGFDQNADFVRAVVRADDETALSFSHFFDRTQGA